MVNVDDAARRLVDLFRVIGKGPINETGIVALVAEVAEYFPQHAILLWEGCVRQRGTKYTVPTLLAQKLRREGLPAVNRSESNGPTHTAYRVGGGITRPSWHHDHIYDGRHALLQRRLDGAA